MLPVLHARQSGSGFLDPSHDPVLRVQAVSARFYPSPPGLTQFIKLWVFVPHSKAQSHQQSAHGSQVSSNKQPTNLLLPSLEDFHPCPNRFTQFQCILTGSNQFNSFESIQTISTRFHTILSHFSHFSPVSEQTSSVNIAPQFIPLFNSIHKIIHPIQFVSPHFQSIQTGSTQFHSILIRFNLVHTISSLVQPDSKPV